MTIETTYILKADEGKILHKLGTEIYTPSVWLKVGESQNDYEEIDEPIEEEEPIAEQPIEEI